MLKTLALAGALFVLGAAPSFAELGEDGLHKEPWFSVTFKDVADDMKAAADQGKRLVLVVEQRGCIYCKKMHEELLTDPEVRDYIKANFMVVQYNMFGDEEVTDLDGDVAPEKKMVAKWGYLFTPTLVFMPEQAPEGQSAAQAAVATMPGAFGKWTFLNMFKWVREKGYQTDEPFQKFHARMIQQLRDQGRIGGN